MAYTDQEPFKDAWGFGKSPFGNKDDKIEKEYGRGFGDKETPHTDNNDE